MKKLLEYLVIFEFLVFSGGIVFCQLYPQLPLALFVVTSFFLYLNTQNHKIPFCNHKILFFLIIWVLLVQFVFIEEETNNYFLIFILNPIGAYLAISSMTFERFRNLALKILTIISVISIIVQILYIFGFPDYPLTPPGKIKPYYMSLYFFNVGWGGDEMSRLSSIYWEPGQYQIILFYILCLFTDKLSDISQWRNILKKFGVLFIALLMTRSTTGYLTFAILIGGILVFSNRNRNVFSSILFMLLGCIFVWGIWNSSVVQDKLEQKDSLKERTSYSIRMADNLACFEITMSSPIHGMGIKTRKLNHQLLIKDSETSSNGWLYTSASLGIPYIIVLLICIWKRIKDMHHDIPWFIPFLVLVISQCNEYALFFPILYIYIFKFNNYQKDKILNETINHNRNLQ